MSNSLSQETSPYLLQHAENPVDWMPWGTAAFERAARENKPVFLSVGYSTCHWCHVMERESFENPSVAAVMNRHFINIKVDREEHPEVDATYMAFVQATTGQGGWPMSVWLTPEGNPIVGGTYFPPQDRFGRPGFVRLCEQIAAVWQSETEKLITQARQTMLRLQQQADHARGSIPPDSSSFDAFLDECAELFDDELGGFGGAPKFPRPVVLEALLVIYHRLGVNDPRGQQAFQMVTTTLHAMAAGGIHDQLRGGFHRYSVDRHWHVPHFEKMLYDQAQLATIYLSAWQICGDIVFRQVAEGIFDYVCGELTDPLGGFHAAEDADSQPAHGAHEKLEGAYWTWSAAEISQLLDPADAALVCAAFGVELAGNARPESDPHHELSGRNVLFRAASPAELAITFNQSPAEIEARLDAARTTMLATRARRPLPGRDDKLITAWNGLMIGALARGARVLERPDLLEAAHAALEFIHANLWNPQTNKLGRSFRQRRSSIDGFPQDYAALIAALIEMGATDPQPRWLDWAVDLQESMDEQFWDHRRAGYVIRSTLGAETIMTLKEDYDGAEPSANSLAANNLLRLASLCTRPDWQQRAEAILAAASGLRAHPFSVPAMLVAQNLAERGPIKLEVGGTQLTHLANGFWHPRLVILASHANQAQLCDPTGCHAPIKSVEQLRQSLTSLPA